MISFGFMTRALIVISLFGAVSLVSASEYVTYLHSDIQGSPVVATNEQGQVVWRESYAPWGQREIRDAATANSTMSSKTWYTGKEEEAPLGLYYYGARWYSADVGQFYSVDPAPVSLDNLRSFGRYHYANNNPIIYKDPDGRAAIFAIPAAYAGIVALTAGINAAIQKIMHGEVQVRGIGGVLDAAGDAALMGPLAIPLGVKNAARGVGNIDDLVRSANRPVNDTGLSAAARKLASHAQRKGGTFEKPTGSVSQQNAQAEKVLREILNNPGSERTALSRGGFEVRMPNGQGVRYEADGSFSGFLDPRR